MIRSICAIARVTIIEQIRNRLYLIILFFAAVMLAAAMLMGSLAPGHRDRVIFDVGLVALELFGLVSAVFGAVTLVLQEIESKTIYLVLTRPVPRPVYVLGRFLGLAAAVAVAMVAMAALHVLILVSHPDWFRDFSYGWSFWSVYPVLVAFSIFKTVVTAAIALFFSLFATSQVSALVFTVCFWIAGHFGQELDFMIRQSTSGGVSTAIARTVAMALPNFQYFNLRDAAHLTALPGSSFFAWALLYGVGYTFFFLALSSLLFSRKEF